MGQWISGESSIVVEAALDACFDVIADMEAYPEWQEMVEAITVQERDSGTARFSSRPSPRHRSGPSGT